MSQVCPKCGNPMNANICSTCGLPSDICACVEIDKETQRIRIYTTRRRFSKPVTIVEGIGENAKQVLRELRKQLATGGTFKEDHIELQGDHKSRLKAHLVKLGYSEDQIDVT